MKRLSYFICLLICMGIFAEAQAQQQKTKPKAPKTKKEKTSTIAKNTKDLELGQLLEFIESDEAKEIGRKIGKMTQAIQPNGDTPVKQYEDITFYENGKEVSLKETLLTTVKNTEQELQANYAASKEKYKKMSFEEFKKEFGATMPVEKEKQQKEKILREIYNEMQKKDGDMLQALFIVMERHKE